MPLPVWIIVAGVLLAALVVAALRLLARTQASVPDSAWLESFSIGRYRPMVRLLAEDDYEFLTAQGAGRAAVRRLRAERRRIFLIYLENLARDFRRLHRIARFAVIESDSDQSDQTAALVRVRLQFSFAVACVRIRVLLHAFGMGSVRVEPVLHSLELLRSVCVTLPPHPDERISA